MIIYTYDELKALARRHRLDALEMAYSGACGHLGGDFSCMDILCCLYYAVMDSEKIKCGSPTRDRFILSKGHCAEALYSVLAGVGMIERAELESYSKFGTKLAGHPTKGIPGVEFATGALGHGLGVGVGMALALRGDYPQSRVFVLCGDGEQGEGSNWEAAMSAAKFGLDSLTLIIDRNRLQISGSTEAVMPLDALEEKYKAFGFETICVNGHEPAELIPALKSRCAGKPTAIIANTVKGCGASILENRAESHHIVLTKEQYELIKAELLDGLEEVSQ